MYVCPLNRDIYIYIIYKSFALLQGAAEVHLSIKPRGHRSHPLGQSSESSLKVILKETAEHCDVEALVEVLEHI